MADENNLDQLRQEYNKFKGKYDLPEFSEMNKIFDIEEIDVESEFLLRKVRRVVSDKIAGYLRFVEIVLNPSNAPMFFFSLIKKLDEGDKKELTAIYETLGKFELEIVKLDLDYSEEKEVDFIKRVYIMFSEDVSKRLLVVIEKMGNGIGKEKKVEKGSYFG